MTKLLLYVLLIGLPSLALPQNTQQIKKDFTAAFSKGKASTLQSYFKSFVKLNISENSGFFSESKSFWILKDFFKKNNVSKFTLKESGFAGDNYYLIGIYTSGNRQWNVYGLFGPGKNGYQIQQLDIEENDL